MNKERNKGDLEVISTLTISQLTNLSLRCDILNTKLFFEYFSPRYKICHLVYFNSLIPFINSYPTPIHYLFYSQRDFFLKNTNLITALLALKSFMVFPPVHCMWWSYGLESSFPSPLPATSIWSSPVTSSGRPFLTLPPPPRPWSHSYLPLLEALLSLLHWLPSLLFQGRGHVCFIPGCIPKSAWNIVGSQQVFLK